MTRYFVRRLFLLVLTILITSFIIFALTNLLPGDNARLVLSRDASPTAIENFEERFGLYKPPLAQYVDWLGGFVTADWGRSYTARNPPVRDLVLSQLGNFLRLAEMTLAIVIPLSLLLGRLPATAYIAQSMSFCEWIRVWILPALTASLLLTGYITQMTRAGMLEELKNPRCGPPRSRVYPTVG